MGFSKCEIINPLSDRVGLSRKKVRKLLDHFCDVVIEKLVTEGEVRLRGLGLFHIKKRPAMTGYDPRLRRPMPVGPTNIVSFRSGVIMRRRIKAAQAAEEEARKRQAE